MTGSYKGQKEIALEVKGFPNMEEALAAAKTVLVRFGQEAVLVMDENHDGSLVYAKHTARLGLMCLTDQQPESFGCVDYTAYANGDYLYAAQDAATGLKLAA